MQEQIRTGLGIKTLGWGIACLLCGIGAILAGALGNITLRIGGLVLPVAVMYIVGGIFILGGIFMVKTAFKEKKCAACNTVLEHGEAYFRMDEEETVLDAARRLDAAPLVPLKKKKKDDKAVVLNLSWCPKCAAVGLLEVENSQGYSRNTLIAEHIVSGPGVGPLAELVLAHETERGDD